MFPSGVYAEQMYTKGNIITINSRPECQQYGWWSLTHCRLIFHFDFMMLPSSWRWCMVAWQSTQKVSFSKLSICRFDFPPATCSASLFGCFLLRLSGSRDQTLLSHVYEKIWPHGTIFWLCSLDSVQSLPGDDFQAKKHNQNWMLWSQNSP